MRGHDQNRDRPRYAVPPAGQRQYDKGGGDVGRRRLHTDALHDARPHRRAGDGGRGRRGGHAARLSDREQPRPADEGLHQDDGGGAGRPRHRRRGHRQAVACLRGHGDGVRRGDGEHRCRDGEGRPRYGARLQDGNRSREGGVPRRSRKGPRGQGRSLLPTDRVPR